MEGKKPLLPPCYVPNLSIRLSYLSARLAQILGVWGQGLVSCPFLLVNLHSTHHFKLFVLHPQLLATCTPHDTLSWSQFPDHLGWTQTLYLNSPNLLMRLSPSVTWSHPKSLPLLGPPCNQLLESTQRAKTKTTSSCPRAPLESNP